MFTVSRFVYISTVVIASTAISFSQTQPEPLTQPQEVPAATQPAPPSDDSSWRIPWLRLLASLVQSTPSNPAIAIAQPGNGCPVEPLDPIDDVSAQLLERSVDSGEVVDLSGMSPAAAGALERFKHSVAAAGGKIVLKSAYRPATYQQHLQNVWYKWITNCVRIATRRASICAPK